MTELVDQLCELDVLMATLFLVLGILVGLVLRFKP